MAGSLLAVTINSQGGSVLTFALPVGVFVVVSSVLYALFSRPHARIPPYRGLATAQTPGPAGEPGARTEGAGQETTAGPPHAAAAEGPDNPSDAAERSADGE